MALAVSCAALVRSAAGALLLMVFMMSATVQAHEQMGLTDASGLRATMPSGVTVTVTRSDPGSLWALPNYRFRGAPASNYSPSSLPTVPTNGYGAFYLLSYDPSSPYGPRQSPNPNASFPMGTVTVTFSRPVKNPRLHFSYMGSFYPWTRGPDNVNRRSFASLQFELMNGATGGSGDLTVFGSSLKVEDVNGAASQGLRIRPASDRATEGCSPFADSAGCGTVLFNGTYTQLTFKVDLNRTACDDGCFMRPDAAGAAGDPQPLPPGFSPRIYDETVFAVSFDEDIGDAPASYGGAGHALGSGLTLGPDVTLDQPAKVYNDLVAATDLSGPAADRDTDDALPGGLANVIGSEAAYEIKNIPVSGNTAAANLCGWIDFNRDGVFNDATERACTVVPPGAASGNLRFTVPPGAGYVAGKSYVRLRLSYSPLPSATGGADSGEVEDYRITLMPRVRLAKSLAPDSDAGRFDLAIDPTIRPDGTTGTATLAGAGHGGAVPSATGFATVGFGAQITVSETAAAGTAGRYQSSLRCVDRAGNAVLTLPDAMSGKFTAMTSASTSGNDTPATQKNIDETDIVCTFSNTRAATFSFGKSIGSAAESPAPSFGFSFSGVSGAVDETITVPVTPQRYGAGAENWSQGVLPIIPGADVVITEKTVHAGWPLYATSTEVGGGCKDNNAGVDGNTNPFDVAINWKVEGNKFTLDKKYVLPNSDFKCAIYNYRPSFGLINRIVGAPFDAGKFDLSFSGVNLQTFIDGGPAPASVKDVGDDGQTARLGIDVNTTMSFKAAAGTGTSLDNYVQTFSCEGYEKLPSSNLANPSRGVYTMTSPAATVTDIDVREKMCTVTHTVRPRVRIVKNSVGGTGTYDFRLTGTVVANATDSVTTSESNVPVPSKTAHHLGTPGTAVSITETAVPDATTQSVCVNGAGRTVAGTGTVALSAADMSAGALWTCTFTNTHARVSTIVSGRVFLDNGTGGGTANDGVANGGEVPQRGVSVRLTDCAAAVHASAVTDAAGNYTLPVPDGMAKGAAMCVEEFNNPGTRVSTGASVGRVALPSGAAVAAGTDTYTYTRTGTPDRIAFAWNGVGHAELNFGDVDNGSFAADGAKTGMPGNSVTYGHGFAAGTAGKVRFGIASETATPDVGGWSVQIFADAGCTGSLQPGAAQLYPPAGAGQAVAFEGRVCVIVKQFIPAAAPLGAHNKVVVQAEFDYANASPALNGRYTLQDITTVSDVALELRKEVRNVTQGVLTFGLNNRAKPGETLEYRITYTNNGDAPIRNLAVNDTTPAYTSFVGATAGETPATLTGCMKNTPANAAPAPAVACTEPQPAGKAGPVDWRFNGFVAPGGSGSVLFQIKVD
ncbi:prealbumin-like fold domain-containing protein [Variovorax sp.]|uniref:prealbumin-like fold domain-containing protein n=1 Tax=Variovorax sp. TaxID=1871043 RepID=UPI003BA8D934